MGYNHLEVEHAGHVATLWLNRPEKRNALSEDMWVDIPEAMAELDADDNVRVVILAGRGQAFSVGIDIEMLASLQPQGRSAAQANQALYHTILRLQETASCFAKTSKPVIAAIHGYCLGAGVDLIAACDVRLASIDAVFSIRETRMGLVADVGSLQRLPAIIGAGALAEMAYTGSDFDPRWAEQRGLVNEVVEDEEALRKRTSELAGVVASNSPLVTAGIKRVLAAAQGRTVDQALDYVAQWNSSFLISNDLMEAISAFAAKRDPDFTGT
jgi:enoyl-CoA hydratase